MLLKTLLWPKRMQLLKVKTLLNYINPTTRTLSLRLSHKEGAVNLEIQ
jgi:hypothetical protein